MASSLIVPVTTIDSIAPHPGADRLEIARVLGWQVVVPKGRYTTGDKVVYFPPDAIVPAEHSDRFGVTQYLQKGRVKCARLRGEPSYGFLAAPDDATVPVGTNLAAHYGVIKYEPPVRVDAGDAEVDDPLFPRYTDIENFRNFPDALRNDEPIVLTEKVHGTNCRVGIVRGQRMAGSMRLRRKEPAAEDLARNTYWLPFSLPPVAALLEHFARNHQQVVLYGEVYGRGIQSFHYGRRSEPGFAVFDLLVSGRYLDWEELQAALQQFGAPGAPVLYEGPFALAVVRAHADGKTTYGDDHIREGVVIRPRHERTDPRIGRVVLKYIGDAYLLDEKKSDFTES